MDVGMDLKLFMVEERSCHFGDEGSRNCRRRNSSRGENNITSYVENASPKAVGLEGGGFVISSDRIISSEK